MNPKIQEHHRRIAHPPPQAGLHLPAPVDAGPSPPPSGEHGAPVRLAGEGAGTGLERISDSPSKECLNLRCDLLDAAVAEEVLKALQPAELELALAAVAELESRDQVLLRQWQMRIERTEYEAALAERRYLEVDPSQRLVASTLERRWNDALLHLEDLKKQATEFRRQEARVATP